MKTATYYKIDGYVTTVVPKNGKHFTYDELRLFVGERVEIVPMPSGDLMVVHEEGKLIGLPENRNATEVWKSEYPIEKYAGNNDELVVGDALVSPAKFIR